MKLAHATWQPSGEGPWPTLFVLHGYGSNALDLLSLAPHLCGGRLMVVAPQGADQVSLGVPVDAREYAMGHEVGARSLGDLSEWLGERLLRRETGARS